MFTKLTTVPCTADKGDLEVADSKAVGLASRAPDPPHFRQVVGVATKGGPLTSRHCGGMTEARYLGRFNG